MPTLRLSKMAQQSLSLWEGRKRIPMKKPSILVSFLPLALLMLMLGVVAYTFGSDSLAGASQTVLLIASAVAIAIGVFGYKRDFAIFEQSIAKAIGAMATPIVILLFIGALSSTWMLSGVVPLFIEYGMHIINPTFFLPIACCITAAVSLLIGSSWTTIATIGLALLSIGEMQGYSPGWIAGALISGAYFGDKMSPLSDTTVLASSTTGVPIERHIRYMFITTVPSMTVALLVFLGFGLANRGGLGAGTADVHLMQALAGTFRLSPFLLVIPVLTGLMIWKRMPSVAVLFLGTMLGVAGELVFQPQFLRSVAETDGPLPLLRIVMQSVFSGVSASTGDAALDGLVTTGGMAGMLNTIWLIICAVIFGSCLQAAGMLQRITEWLVGIARGVCGMVSSTVFATFLLNVLTGDQYAAILLSGQMFGKAYQQEGLESRLLSRSLEDGGTVTSVLVPWNTCGMTQSTVLGVPTLTYLPYCVFNYVSPLMSILISAVGYKIYRHSPLAATATPKSTERI